MTAVQQLTLEAALQQGRSARDVGIAQVDGNVDLFWSVAADRAIEKLAASGRQFGPDDVREIAGSPDRHQAMGARFMAAVKRGVIVRCGTVPSRRASCHAHRNSAYIGTQHQDVIDALGYEAWQSGEGMG